MHAAPFRAKLGYGVGMRCCFMTMIDRFRGAHAGRGLLALLGLLATYALYLAALCSRRSRTPEDHLDAGQRLPGWAYAFAATGVTLAVFEPFDHFRLLAAYGYQYNETVLGLILVALCSAVFQKRIWLASKVTVPRLNTFQPSGQKA